jgi:carbon monoxide dehydrogenase subunit G
MQLSGNVVIKAPRGQVWEFLTDVTKVAQCAPGVESVELLEGGQKFKAVAAIGFGSVKARFSGDAEWVEQEAPNRAKVKAHGNAPGSAADVLAEMLLAEVEGGTQMSWTAEVTVLGQLASLAARMMTPVSQKLTEQFFNVVKQKIEVPPAPAPPAPTPPA